MRFLAYHLFYLLPPHKNSSSFLSFFFPSSGTAFQLGTRKNCPFLPSHSGINKRKIWDNPLKSGGKLKQHFGYLCGFFLLVFVFCLSSKCLSKIILDSRLFLFFVLFVSFACQTCFPVSPFPSPASRTSYLRYCPLVYSMLLQALNSRICYTCPRSPENFPDI